MIRALLKEPDSELEERYIENDYKEIRKIVGELFDIALLPTDKIVDIYFNDEGILLGMEPNLVLLEYRTILVGPIVFTSYNSDSETISLNDTQIEHIKEYVDILGVIN